MLRNPAYWCSCCRGEDDELRLSRAFSFSDRCRYYWPQPSVQEEVKRLLHNLDLFSCPLTMLSQSSRVTVGLYPNRSPSRSSDETHPLRGAVGKSRKKEAGVVVGAGMLGLRFPSVNAEVRK